MARKTAVRFTPSLVATWGATFALGLALAASIWPAVLYDEPLDYNVEAMVLAITAVALFWTAYYTRAAIEYQRTRDKADEWRRRRALATAMGAELARLERSVRSASDEPKLVFEAGATEHPVLDKALESSSLFQPRTVEKIARLLGTLADLRIEAYKLIEVHRKTSSGSPTALKKFGWFTPILATKIKDGSSKARLEIKALQTELANELKKEPKRRAAPRQNPQGTAVPDPNPILSRDWWLIKGAGILASWLMKNPDVLGRALASVAAAAQPKPAVSTTPVLPIQTDSATPRKPGDPKDGTQP